MEKEESIILKPEFNEEIKAEIKGISEIENNIGKAKEYAVALSNYYKKTTFTEKTMKEATDEKAKVNKFKEKVADFRKSIIEEFNEPIKDFENIAKETEALLDSTYKTINGQVQNYNDSKKRDIEDKLKEFFAEYRTFKKIDESYLRFEELNISVTLGHATDKGELTKKSKEEVSDKIDNIVNQIDAISSMQYSDEILVEYLKNKNLTQAIKDVNDRHFILDKVQKKKEEKKEEIVTDEEIIKKIDNLVAPKVVEEKQETEEIRTLEFNVTDTPVRLLQIIQFLDDGGFKYEQQ